MKPRMIEHYMKVAELTAELSRARRLQVGCVIVKDDNIISFGWNGTPPGWDNNCEYEHYSLGNPNEYELRTKPEVIHAEANALIKLARSAMSSEGASMFLTHAPCIECAKLIASSKITDVYFKSIYRSNEGIKFLNQSDIKIQHLSC